MRLPRLARRQRAHTFRPVPFREDHCVRTVRGALTAAVAASGQEGIVEIPPKVIFFLADGKVHGNESRLFKGLVADNGKAIAKNKQAL